jgi:carbonic anhydrase
VCRLGLCTILVNCRFLPSWSNKTRSRHLLHSTRHSLYRYRLHRLELNAITDPEQRYRRLVELNVIEQCLNLFKTGVVQKKRVDTYKEGGEYTTPQIHACVFDPSTGDMKKLPVCNEIWSWFSQGGILSVLLNARR